MKKKLLLGMVCALLAMAGREAAAVDGMALELGSGDGPDMVRLSAQWDWGKRWFQGADWHVGGFWDFGAGYWKNSDAMPRQNEQIAELGLTPVLRLQRNGLAGPYLEAGIGVHVLSRTQLGDKRLSTQFQFGDHLGFGYRFGARSAWDLGYRFQHLSNANIKKPNDGINFHQARLLHWF
jgi:lipid A 3-O-deacylase